jgi:ABC-type transport system involved in multi-copper enzyme maturation permease subunit
VGNSLIGSFRKRRCKWHPWGRIITLIAGVLVVLLGFWRFAPSTPRMVAWAILGLSVVITGVGAYNIATVQGEITDSSNSAASASVGVGLFVVVVGGVVALFGSARGKVSAPPVK